MVPNSRSGFWRSRCSARRWRHAPPTPGQRGRRHPGWRRRGRAHRQCDRRRGRQSRARHGHGCGLGGMLGNRIGAAMDDEDKRRAYAAQVQALESGPSGAPVAWRNPDSGGYGSIVPGPAYDSKGMNCRQFTHTIYIDGKPQTARGTACRNRTAPGSRCDARAFDCRTRAAQAARFVIEVAGAVSLRSGPGRMPGDFRKAERFSLAGAFGLYSIAFLALRWPWLSGTVKPLRRRLAILSAVGVPRRSFATGQSPFWTPNIMPAGHRSPIRSR